MSGKPILKATLNIALVSFYIKVYHCMLFLEKQSEIWMEMGVANHNAARRPHRSRSTVAAAAPADGSRT